MRVWLSATRSFAFATALLVARLAGLTRPEGLNVPSASRGFYIRAFRSPGRPESLPDITTAPNRELRRRDFHPLAQQLVSLHRSGHTSGDYIETPITRPQIPTLAIRQSVKSNARRPVR